ncbi:MAG: nucleotidyltransferase domain-containing protein [Paludibacter sp.]
MNNAFGLSEHDMDVLKSVLSSYSQVDEAIIFGSRSKGNFRNGSDVDIALKGLELNLDIVSKISYTLNEETTMPYKFDILNYNSISNNELIDHINRVWISIYHS